MESFSTSAHENDGGKDKGRGAVQASGGGGDGGGGGVLTSSFLCFVVYLPPRMLWITGDKAAQGCPSRNKESGLFPSTNQLLLVCPLEYFERWNQPSSL